MNHGPRFWEIVDSLVGHSKRSQAWLAENGAVLHRYAPRKLLAA
jgi:predicted metal-dependent hydrolase